MDPLGDYNCHYDGKLTIFVNCLADGWFCWLSWLDWVRQASLVLLVRCESSPGKV